MRAALAAAFLAFAGPGAACEASADWFAGATSREMIDCMRLDFVTPRAGASETVLHLAVGARAGPDVLDALRAAARTEWATMRDRMDVEGRTALHVAAARAEDARVMTWLLAAGMDADAGMPPIVERNLRGDLATRPLHLAARRADGAGLVTALLAGGADAGRRDAVGDLPVHLAADIARQTDVLAAFLAHAGGDGDVFDSGDAEGRTALIRAARADAPEAVLRLMLEAGADADLRDEAGQMALHLAAEHGTDADALRLLFDYTDEACLSSAEVASPLDRLTKANEALGADAGLVRLFGKACADAP